MYHIRLNVRLNIRLNIRPCFVWIFPEMAIESTGCDPSPHLEFGVG